MQPSNSLLLVSGFVYIFLSFFHPPTAMLWSTDQQLISYQMKFCLKWLLRRKIKGRMSYWRRRLACSVTRLSRICLSKTFPLLTSFWHPRHCLWSFSLSFVQSHQHYVTNYKSNPASLNAFLHIGHPYWRQQIYAKAEKSSFCSSLQCW